MVVDSVVGSNEGLNVHISKLLFFSVIIMVVDSVVGSNEGLNSCSHF